MISVLPRTLHRLSLLLAALCLLAPVANAESLGVCSSFYNSSFTLTEGKVNPTMTSLAKPAKGTVLKEPNFNTCLVRATDHSSEGLGSFARNDYSRRQAFNANNTYFISYTLNGSWHLYNADTLAHIRQLGPSSGQRLAGDAEPHWHPTNPNILYYLPTNGGTKLYQLNVQTNTPSLAADFAGKLPSWGASAAHIWTKSEGSPSADGRYWGFQVEDSNFKLLGFMVWDLQENKLIGSRQHTSRPDHSSMSAAGRWFVTSSDSEGTWAWSPNFSVKKKLLHKSEHSDLALGPNGEDYYVSIDYQSSSGDVFFVDIDACPSVPASATNADVCPRTVLFPTYINGAATAMHFSGKGFNKPGWLVLSTYAASNSRDGSRPWYTDKVYAIELKKNPLIYTLAYTRRVGGGTYWSEPHATVSRDFTRIAFNSNWGVSGDDIDTYIIHIPKSALPSGTTTASRVVTGGNMPTRQSSSSGYTTGASSVLQRNASTAVTTTEESATTTDTEIVADTEALPAPAAIRVGNPHAQRLARVAAAEARRLFSTLLSLRNSSWLNRWLYREEDELDEPTYR
ncbi:hypothetical protein CSC70_10080 [Pseudoxanthomonas kalamensis DSM 18571]|uniref:hypothetical protein n=1 Tax=Pseudoxanthomonas kalamensis TaxID=289483 RepID=UPI00139193A8|nr:hypothetical protein [Pseudoxanthomonas kalamensis]KAF1710012.1 hypothetical protein CSC70_10080 [Pseudoxanthomonas kalamensis DSM 18571]